MNTFENMFLSTTKNVRVISFCCNSVCFYSISILSIYCIFNNMSKYYVYSQQYLRLFLHVVTLLDCVQHKEYYFTVYTMYATTFNLLELIESVNMNVCSLCHIAGPSQDLKQQCLCFQSSNKCSLTVIIVTILFQECTQLCKSSSGHTENMHKQSIKLHVNRL